ncbi:DUF551 domain-containing protein [Escherichia coli]|uniref:DUF551 domain-containing protein n=1 Tax=Escherichia coli TaxID=562 RepID=UPI0028FC28F7|nr:DUF551 domain-containing protein [Escherichia coli]WNW46386.1 DUF551 domain-containing protein [Escherichia coli]
MTTNNHPAHGPVSLDRLHQISEILSKASAQSDGGNLGYAMADAVKVIDGFLASKNVAPVVPDELVNNIDNPYGDEDLIYEQGKIDGWNACRAAMIQSFGNSEQLDEVGSWNNHMNTPTAQSGNSPVTPDGWIPVSERTPEEGQEIIVMDVTRGKVQSGMIYQNGRFVDFNEEYYEVKSPSHWMPLPAAPQQEVK